jgi:hypothetical protein
LDGNGVSAAFVLPGVAETLTSIFIWFNRVNLGLLQASHALTAVVLVCISTGEEPVRAPVRGESNFLFSLSYRGDAVVSYL